MKRNHWVLLILTCLLAAFLRFVFLEKIPLRVDGDSSKFGIEAINSWKENRLLFSTGWYGHSNVLFYLIGLFIKIFGDPLLGVRMFSALGGFLAVIAVFLLGKKIDLKVGLWAAFFLALCPFHILLSRVGTEAIWMTFFVSIIFYLLLSYKIFLVFLSGLIMGFSQYIYPGSRIIPILAVMIIAVKFFNKKTSLKKTLFIFLVLSLGFLFAYFPMIHYFVDHPDEYFARINIVGLWQSGWLGKEMVKRSLVSIFIEKIYDNYLVFWLPIKRGAHFWFFRTPYLDLFPSFIFLAGLIISLLEKKKKEMSVILFFSFFITVFFAGILTVDSPTPSRHVIVFPFIAVFVGVGIERILRISGERKFTLVFPILISVLIAGNSFFSLKRHETIDTWNYDINTQIATFAGRYLDRIDEDYQTFFLGNSNMCYSCVPTLEFLSKKKGIDLEKPLLEEIDKISQSKPSVFLILPERKEEVEILRNSQIFSGKIYEVILSNPKGEAVLYLVSDFDTESF